MNSALGKIGIRSSLQRLRRIALIVAVNLILFLVFAGIAEVSYRIYRVGLAGTFVPLLRGSNTPYSSLGTGEWVIGDQDLGYRLNPTQEGINSLSVRHEEIDVPKTEGVFRVLFLGDSVQFDHPGYVSYTRDRLEQEGNFEVINASVPGYTTYQQVTWLDRDLLQTSPDLIVLSYVLNDNHQFLHRFNKESKMIFTREALDVLKVDSAFDEIVSRSFLLVDLKFNLMELMGNNGEGQEELRYPWEHRPDFKIAWKDEPWVQFEAHLLRMKELAEQHGGKFAVVVFPFEPQLDPTFTDEELPYVTKPQRRVTELCDAYQIPCLDLLPSFSAEYQNSEASLYRDGIHLNEPGHTLAAQKIYEFLNNERLLPRNSET